MQSLPPFSVGGTIYFELQVKKPSDGVTPVAPNSTPVVTVYKNGTATGESSTVTALSGVTGGYSVSLNPAGDAESDNYILKVEAGITDADYNNGNAFTHAEWFHTRCIGVLSSGVNVTQVAGTNVTAASGRMEVNTSHWGGTAVGSASVRSNLISILGTTLTETVSGYLTAGFKKLFDVATPVLTTASVNQTGDSFARIGTNGAGLTTLATAAQINSLSVNTRANIQVPIEIEIPDSSTQVYKIRLHLYDEEGNMESPDSTPTIALTNAAGTDRSSRLSAATTIGTGAYSWNYTATAGDAEEQLVWVFTVVEGSLTRTYPATSYVVEETAFRFSSSDRATLNATATASALSTVASDVTTIKTDTGNLVTRIPSTLFSGITSLADWIRRISRKDAGTPGMIAAEAEIDTGGTSTFDGTTDSLEAIADASGGGGGEGDALEETSQSILAAVEEVQADVNAIRTSLGVTASATPRANGYVDGLREPLIIGDDYTSGVGRLLEFDLVDANGEPADVAYGSKTLADSGISIQMLLKPSGKSTGTATLVGTCTYTAAPDAESPATLQVSLPRTQTALAVPGSYDLQVEAKWSDSSVVTFLPYGKVIFEKDIRRPA